MDDNPKRKPGSLLKRALFNQYNYILLGSTALFSVTTGSWLPAVIGAGVEILWLVLGADTKAFRHWVAKQESAEAKQQLRAEISALLRGLDEHYTERFEVLMQLNAEVQALARENKGLETALIADEMAKLEQLLHSFLKMASGHQRLAHYMREHSVADVEDEIADTSRRIKRETDHRVQASLKQSLALAQKRLRSSNRSRGPARRWRCRWGRWRSRSTTSSRTSSASARTRSCPRRSTIWSAASRRCPSWTRCPTI